MASIHIDYAGPYLGRKFLIFMNVQSKWMDMAVVSSATSTATIEKPRTMFAIYIIPETLVSDNRTAFTSLEFQVFLKQSRIHQICTVSYHPATNCVAERAV